MRTLILAHRGYAEIAPENTKLAFDAAHMFAFDGLEIDVHMTKDNQLVIIHDEDVQRTGNGTGKIQDLTLTQIQKLDFAAQFGLNYPPQKIMTYETFLKTYGDRFRVLNVEIKTDVTHYPGIEKLIWATHQKIKPQAQIIYSSFNFESLQILRQISKKALLGFLFVDEHDCVGKEDQIKAICNYLHPWFKSMLNQKSRKFYQSLNLPLNLWTFDKRETGDVWTAGSHQAFRQIYQMPNVYALISNSKY